MEMKCMKTKRILSAALALLLVASLPVTAFAAEWNIADGDITVNAGSGGQTVTQGTNVDIPDDAPVITGSSTTSTVTITAAENQTANVTLKDVNIDVSGIAGSAAVSTSGEGDVTIELEGKNTVKSGNDRAGLEKNNDGELTITDANNDSGSLDATGGAGGAGIGGGYHGSGSNITITGGSVTATGGVGGAGVGGGSGGSGSNITITGGSVTAMGGFGGAGIGGGSYGSGSNITITGGEVNAQGGDLGAGIGGGTFKDGSDITVSGDAQVKVQGGKETEFGPNFITGTGAPIGNGGHWNPMTEEGVNGAEVAPDVSELSPEGKIEYYAPGADMEKDAPIEDKTVIGKHEHQWVAGEVTKEPTCTETGVRIDTCISDETKSFTRTVELPLREHEFKDYVPDGNASCENDGTKTAKCVWYDQCGKTHTVQDEGSRLIRTETAPLYRVKDADGRGVNYKAERKDGVLTVTVDADFAVLTGTLDGISTLKAQGVEKIVFVTKSAKSTFALADLLEKGSRGETYKLTHDGKTVTFTLGAKMTDVSDILKKT